MPPQQMAELSKSHISHFATPQEMDEQIALKAAQEYVAEHMSSSFDVIYANNTERQDVCRFFIRSQHGPLGVLELDLRHQKIIQLTEDEIRIIQEKAAIYEARTKGILPVGKDGNVLAEYARRKAEKFLNEHLGMFFNAVEPVYVLREPPLWQVTIVFKMQDIGPFTLTTMDVDAKTGEPIALTEAHIKHIKERAHDIVEYRTQATAAAI